jgi:hypothetical protein
MLIKSYNRSAGFKCMGRYPNIVYRDRLSALFKVIRARQEKTGESYTTARLHVLRARDENLHGKSLLRSLAESCHGAV